MDKIPSFIFFLSHQWEHTHLEAKMAKCHYLKKNMQCYIIELGGVWHGTRVSKARVPCKQHTIPNSHIPQHSHRHTLFTLKKKKTKISSHTLHQCTLHAFLTLLSKILERETIQMELAVVLDMGQRDVAFYLHQRTF